MNKILQSHKEWHNIRVSKIKISQKHLNLLKSINKWFKYNRINRTSGVLTTKRKSIVQIAEYKLNQKKNKVQGIVQGLLQILKIGGCQKMPATSDI